LGRDVKTPLLLGLASKTNLLALGITVLLHVLLSTLEDRIALLLVGLFIAIIRNFHTKPMRAKGRVVKYSSDPKDG
jgi:uncharacterized membrane protein